MIHQMFLLEERIVEIKKVSVILGNLEELIKNHDAKIRTEIYDLSKQAKALEEKVKSLEAGVIVVIQVRRLLLEIRSTKN